MPENRDNELRQQIIIFGEGSHEDVVYAAVRACLRCYELWGHIDEYQEWLKGRFTKTVRVAKTKAIFDLIYQVQGPFGYSAQGGVQAIALLPDVLDRDSFVAKKTQVSGLNRERKGWHGVAGWLYGVAINPEVEMTTGKEAAQACHGALAMLIADDNDFNGTQDLLICSDDMVFNMMFKRWVDEGLGKTYPIYDAGFTEVDPHTLTVIAAAL